MDEEHGEKIAAAYLSKQEFRLIAQNVSRKTGEIDLIARKGNTLHFIEVKSRICEDFRQVSRGTYAPSDNLNVRKIHKVRRTSEWYVAEIGWEGEAQIDGMLIWIRKADGRAKVRYLPQLLA